MTKKINVAAAVIYRINNGTKEIFSTQRGYGDYKGFWEFPGGKIEKDENAEQAVIREIKEELETDIAVDSFIDTVEYDYPSFHLTMSCFVCHVLKGDLFLKEHLSSKWLNRQSIDSVEWLEADRMILDKVKEIL